MIECNMTKVNKRSTSKNQRHHQACDQVIVHEVGIGASSEGGRAVATGTSFGTDCRKNVDVLVPPPKPSCSSKPISSSSLPISSSSFIAIALQNNEHSIIMPPEKNDREVATNSRRSDRLSKSNGPTIAVGSTSIQNHVLVNTFIDGNVNPLCVKKKVSGSTTITKNIQINSFIDGNSSPLCVEKKLSGSTSIKKNVKVNSFIDGNFSPLCVKKKMCRRTRIRNEGHQALTNLKCANSNKKLPLTKVNAILIDETENDMVFKTEANAIRIKKNCERDAIQPVTKKCVSFSKCTPNSDAGTTVNRVDQDCGILAELEDIVTKKCVSFSQCTPNSDTGTAINRVSGNRQMNLDCDSAGEREDVVTKKCVLVSKCTSNTDTGTAVVAESEDVLTNESILFEESPDFWNRFLLDTYRQIAFNNPDVPDFEPIPYAMSARGIPVEPDMTQDSNTALLCNATTTDSTGEVTTASSSNPKQTRPPIKQKLQDKTCVAAKLVHGRDEDRSGDSNNVVGPDSWQMDVINRMLFYLECETNHPHSTYHKQMRDIKELCTKRHTAGSLKYRHLPGAIFDQVVKTIGGSIFLSIYKAAKCLSYGRLESDSCVPVEKEDSTGGRCAPSNLIQFAVGYGYCMAKTTERKRQKLCPDRNKARDIQDTTEIGAQTVLNMSDDTRLSFWNEYILKVGDNE